jgi:parallel beta-helix repeat protein
VEDNTVNGKPLVYLEDVSDCKVEDAGQVILLNCTNITIQNLDLSNTTVGIELWGTVDCTISNSTVSNQ